MSVTADTEGTDVECDNCGYTWTYTGSMWTTTCPNCNRKTDTGLGTDECNEHADNGG